MGNDKNNNVLVIAIVKSINIITIVNTEGLINGIKRRKRTKRIR